jgi:hypothetical protein
MLSSRRGGGHRTRALVRAFIGRAYELWVGDPAQIRTKRVRKQSNDRYDVQHMLRLMREDDFPVSCPRRRIAMYGNCDASTRLVRMQT